MILLSNLHFYEKIFSEAEKSVFYLMSLFFFFLTPPPGGFTHNPLRLVSESDWQHKAQLSSLYLEGKVSFQSDTDEDSQHCFSAFLLFYEVALKL